MYATAIAALSPDFTAGTSCAVAVAVENRRFDLALRPIRPRKKQSPVESAVDLALGQFGFKFSRTNTLCKPDDTGDLKLVGLTVVAISITLIGLAAWGSAN